jgi:aminomethyltransferase
VGEEGTVSRTGYTGEDGFEVIVPTAAGLSLWTQFMTAASDGKLALAGLGSRDTLRLEAALPLYGHELDETINPLEAGLGRFVRLDKTEFAGREALAGVADAGPKRQLIGLEVPDGAIARQSTPVEADGRQVGQVSSGTFSPTLERSIAMAFVAAEVAQDAPSLSVVIRGNTHPSQLVDLPFFHGRKRK